MASQFCSVYLKIKKLRIMNRTEMLSLINGKFNGEEANEILLNLFSTKIHFHELKNFSSRERFGKDDETAQRRIPELKKGREKVKQMVAEAKAKDKHLVITSVINISLEDE